MLPDLRVLLIATVSTFLVASCAAFFVSVRVVPDQLAQPDQSTPVSRVAVSWQDISRTTLRAINSAAPQTRDVPQAASESNSGEPGKGKPSGESAPSRESAAAETPAGRTEPAASQTPRDDAQHEQPYDARDEPASTGTITAAPPAESGRNMQQLAARPDPANIEDETEEQQPDAAPAVRHRTGTGSRARKRHRFVHRDIFGNPARTPDAGDLSFEFFTNFGSHTR